MHNSTGKFTGTYVDVQKEMADVMQSQRQQQFYDAVTTGNQDLVKKLLDHGADVNLKSDLGKAPTTGFAPAVAEFFKKAMEKSNPSEIKSGEIYTKDKVEGLDLITTSRRRINTFSEN